MGPRVVNCSQDRAKLPNKDVLRFFTQASPSVPVYWGIYIIAFDNRSVNVQKGGIEGKKGKTTKHMVVKEKLKENQVIKETKVDHESKKEVEN